MAGRAALIWAGTTQSETHLQAVAPSLAWSLPFACRQHSMVQSCPAAAAGAGAAGETGAKPKLKSIRSRAKRFTTIS